MTEAKDNWRFYDEAAKWCAIHGLKGKHGDPLPNLLDKEVYDLINADHEAFERRVRETAYALAMEKIHPGFRAACMDAAKEWLKFNELQCHPEVLVELIERHLAPFLKGDEHEGTQALVAAAYAACAKTCLGNVLSEEQMNGEPNLHVGEMCLRLCHERDAAAIRKLTPADAARELERVKASSFLAGQAEECGGTPKGIVQASARGKEK